MTTVTEVKADLRRDVTEFLRTIDYPATTEDIIRAAVQDRLDAEVLSRLAELPRESFQGAYCVRQALRRETAEHHAAAARRSG